MYTDEKMPTDNEVINEEPKCYGNVMFIILLIIICLCIILPLGFTYKHKSQYSTYEPNPTPIIYYPTSQPTYLYLRHNF